jgi:hypothetical protein
MHQIQLACCVFALTLPLCAQDRATLNGTENITSILNTGAVGTGTPRRVEFAARLDF